MKSSVLYFSAIASSLLAYAPARADIVSADVGDNLEYQQTAPSTVSPANGGTNGFFFARAFFNPGDFDGGNVSFSGPASPQTFNASGLLDCCGHFGMAYQTSYITPAFQSTNFPTGITYTITATNSVTSASQSVNILFAQDLYSTVTPALTASSFSALQNLNPNAAMTIGFNNFAANANAGFAQTFFTIYDLTANTTVVNDAGLDPSTTSVSVAAGTFIAAINTLMN